MNILKNDGSSWQETNHGSPFSLLRVWEIGVGGRVLSDWEDSRLR